jgi:uncharacterized membrane-anchored protein
MMQIIYKFRYLTSIVTLVLLMGFYIATKKIVITIILSALTITITGLIMFGIYYYLESKKPIVSDPTLLTNDTKY